MLQIDHIYEFFHRTIFHDFGIGYFDAGATNPKEHDIKIFNRHTDPRYKMFFFDQEPLVPSIHQKFLDTFENIDYKKAVRCIPIFVVSEKSELVDNFVREKNYYPLYYFFHGFAAIDWFRGHQALYLNTSVIRSYHKDYVCYNRIIATDRSYRINLLSQLVEHNLVEQGLISFGVAHNDERTYIDEINSAETKLSTKAIQHIKNHLPKVSFPLYVDKPLVPGYSSADIPRTIELADSAKYNYDAFWHVVPETVFYYDKLHLTEKIFKPIVCKQPFMLLAAPGNLEYLKSYGFKTFDSVIDESYDTETDNDLRIQKVVAQLNWYCGLSSQEKTRVQQELEPIIEYNFRHFYGEFRHIITTELLSNCQTLFKQIGYDDSAIAYKELYRVLTS